MYSDTCINRSCSKAETLLRRAGVWSRLFSSLSCISKAEIVKRTLLQTGNFFRSSDKKATCLMRTQRKNLGIPGNRDLNWTFLSVFSKRNIFLHLRTTIILFDFIFQFGRSTILLSQTVYLIFRVALCNQSTVFLRHWKWY